MDCKLPLRTRGRVVTGDKGKCNVWEDEKKQTTRTKEGL